MIDNKESAIVLVFNSNNELLLQLRAADDDSFPSHWDFSAGGGIDDGGDPKISAERELTEELGITAPVEPIGREECTYPAWNPANTRAAVLYLFKTSHEGPFKPDPKEVQKVEFFSFDQIDQMLASGEKFHPEFMYVWNNQNTFRKTH